MQILIIDDHEETCYYISQVLKLWGIKSDYVCSLSEIRNIQCNKHPEYIFLDNKLPDGYGISNIEHVKNYFPDSKIIYMSAEDNFSLPYLAIENGARHFMLKPFSIEEIANALKSCKSIHEVLV